MKTLRAKVFIDFREVEDGPKLLDPLEFISTVCCQTLLTFFDVTAICAKLPYNPAYKTPF